MTAINCKLKENTDESFYGSCPKKSLSEQYGWNSLNPSLNLCHVCHSPLFVAGDKWKEETVEGLSKITKPQDTERKWII